MRTALVRLFSGRTIAVLAILGLIAVATTAAAARWSGRDGVESSLAVVKVGDASSPNHVGPSRLRRAKPAAKVARRGHLPKRFKLTHPRALHLKAAHGKVFDVRKLHGNVIKRERPEVGSQPFEAAEAGRSTSPAQVLPKVLRPGAIASSSAPAAAPDNSFEGLDFANWGQGHPPDTNGDVGPNYYIQTINVSIGIYDKTSGNRVAAFTFNSFMGQGHFGNLCDTDNFGDPVVIYDSFEDRWVITDFAFKLDGAGNVVNPPGAFQCFAVSKTGDPVTGGWNFYSIAAPGALNDYPKFGVWPDGIYMSANMFGYPAGASYQGYHVWALNKQQMYAGAPTVQVVDFAGDTSDFTVIPANARLQAGTPPAGSSEYFVSTEQFLNAVSIYKFHVDWDKVSTSTFTGPNLAAAATCWPNAAVANASTPANSADTLSIRAMAQAQYSNLGGAESLWVDHTVNRGDFPLASCGGANTNNATIRWYQANVTGGTVAANLVQGASFDPDGANTFFRFMPALAVDHAGDLAIGYTKSNSTTNPQLKYAGRLAGDPLGTLGQGEQTLIDGAGAQSGNCGGAPCTRWGDYSGMALDPNGCEFWETGEYFATTGLNHQTRIGSFHFPGCTTVGNGTVSGTVTDGAGPLVGATVALGNRTTTTNGSGAYSFNVPAGTYPSISASMDAFNPSTASSISVPDGGTATRNFALTGAAQSGCFTDNSQSTFQRGVPSNCDLNASPGNVVLTNQPTLDQQQLNSSNSGFNISTTQWIGQTFVPGVTGQLKRLDLNLFCASCSGTDQPLTVEVRTTSANLPTSTVLASTTIPGFSSGAAAFYTATFASPPTLTAGTKYALVVRLQTARTGSYDAIFSTGPTAYASGDLVATTNSGASWIIPTAGGTARDMSFKTYMSTGFASSGTLVSSLKDTNPNPGSSPHWTTLAFSATTPAGTAVKFQVAGSNTRYGPFNFVGPDGTASTFFTTSGASLSQFDGFRYLKYKAILTTTNGAVTPTLSSVQVCFTDVAPTSATGLAVDPANGTYGGSTTLSATLTSGASPVTGEPVAFTLRGTSVGSATTNASGVATLNGVSLSGIDAGSYPAAVAASFAGDSSYDPSSASNTLTVAKADQTISFPAITDFSWKGGSATLSAAASSGLDVSYSVLSGPCSVTGSTLTATHAGSCQVAADQAGNGNYNPAPQATRTATVAKADQAITVTTHAPSSKAYNTSFDVAATGGDSGNAVTFSSAGSCTNTGATFTMTSGTGSCSVKYDQAGNGDYNPAPQVTESVNATKAGQSINVTIPAPENAVFGTSFAVSATGGGSGNPVTFSSAGACSNTGSTYQMTSGTGTCSVKYDQAGDANYAAAAQVTESVTAQKADQTVTVVTHAPSSAVYNASFSVAAGGGGSGNPIVYSSAGSCSNSGSTYTMTSGGGTCTVEYDQAGDDNYAAASQVSENVTAQKAGQTITITTHAPVHSAFGTSFTVAATGGGSGNAVSFSSDGACSNSGATFTMTSGTGTCSVKYDQAGDSNYNAAPQVTETVDTQKVDQAINVTTHGPASAAYGTSFTVAATGGGSGNPIVYSSDGSCSNSGATFTITSGGGTCTVKYDQAGSDDYNAAPQVTESVDAQKAGQTIHVTTTAPSSGVYNTSFSVAATGGGSGNPVTFSSGGGCSNSGASFTMTSGTTACSVKYDQAGDSNYNAAPQISESVDAQKAGQSISFAQPADKTYGDPDFTVSATASSGLSVSFAASGQCTVSGATVHLTGPGSCTITASQAGSDNYSAATDVPRTFQISSAAPVSKITTPDIACSQFANGSAASLGEVDFTVKSSQIRLTTPTGFFYWVPVNATAGPHTYTIHQSITSGAFTTLFALGGGSNVFTSSCAKGLRPVITSQNGGETVTFSFTARTAGTFYLAAKYNTTSLRGSPAPTGTVHFQYSTAGISNSTSGIDLKKQTAAQPARHALRFFWLLRR